MAVNELPIESNPQAHILSRDLESGLVRQDSAPAAKISLFRSLFRGRQNVYARRFESRKTGRAGYRRDRRKDALLQENGYFVLRFLAEDVGKRLDQVLDTILRALGRRPRRPA